VFFVTISRSHRKKATLIHTFLSHHRSSSASDLLIFNLPGEKFATLSTLTVYRWFLNIVVVWNSRKLMCGAWTEKVYGIPNAEVGLTRKRIMTTRPPFSRETAIQKVRWRKTVGILAIRTNARTPIQADPYLLGKINHAGNHLTY
jgi:hypothetical protein